MDWMCMHGAPAGVRGRTAKLATTLVGAAAMFFGINIAVGPLSAVPPPTPTPLLVGPSP